MELEYRKVYKEIRKRIERGEYPVGACIPTESELEKIFLVSRTTIRRAVGLLIDDGLVEPKQGYGTEVKSLRPVREPQRLFRFHGVPAIEERLIGESAAARYTASTYIDVCTAPPKVAATLCVPDKTEVYRVQRLNVFGDGTPFCYKVNYLRMDLVPGLEKYTKEFVSLYTLLREKYDVEFQKGSETITAVTADFTDSRVLDVEIGSPLLLFCRYAYTNDGTMEYAETRLRPEYYELRVNMEGHPGADMTMNLEHR